MIIKKEPLEIDGVKCIAQSFVPKNKESNYYNYLEDNSNRSFAYRYKTETGWRASTAALSSYSMYGKKHQDFPDGTTHEDVAKWALDMIKEHYPERYERILNPEFTISFTAEQWKMIALGLDMGWSEGVMVTNETRAILKKIKECCPGAVHETLVKELEV